MNYNPSGADMRTDQSQSSSKTSALDAVDLLKADHEEVRKLFDQLDMITKQGASDAEKSSLVAKIRDKLSVHESVENDVFFPAVREILRKKDVLQEATEDQEEAGDAIQALGELNPGDAGYDKKLSELGSKIAAHAAEEESDVFPQVKNSNIDSEALGQKMSARKEELKQAQDQAAH
jgi:hemerythrin superfamily protein